MTGVMVVTAEGLHVPVAGYRIGKGIADTTQSKRALQHQLILRINALRSDSCRTQ